MKKYVVYTIDGYTEDLDGNESFMCQMLGVFTGEDESQAIENAKIYLITLKLTFENFTALELAN